MNDLQCAVLLIAGALAWLYLKPAVARESDEEGLLAERAASDEARAGLRSALLGHAASLALTVPVFAHLGFDRPSGRWLSGLFWLWARFAGAVQLVYLVPLGFAAKKAGRTAELQGLELAGKITAAGSVLLWALDMNRLAGRSALAPAASALAVIGCGLYLLLLFARLRRALR